MVSTTYIAELSTAAASSALSAENRVFLEFVEFWWVQINQNFVFFVFLSLVHDAAAAAGALYAHTEELLLSKSKEKPGVYIHSSLPSWAGRRPCWGAAGTG